MTMERTLPDIPVHDPFILPDAASGTYYLYTAFDGKGSRYASDGLGDPRFQGNGVLAWRSTDLVTWSDPTAVFENAPGAWCDPASPPWAPEVHRYRGRYYLFLTLHDPATRLPRPRQQSTEIRMTSADGQDDGPIRRGTCIAVADSPLGPFVLLDAAASQTPVDFVTLDGTLHVDHDGTPWMVYAHEWVQAVDGTIEAIPLVDDLSRASGPPVHLFRASEACWFRSVTPGVEALAPYVTDGPFLRRLPGGALALVWASYRRSPERNEYVETYAVSESGDIRGPWVQREILVDGNAGHGSVFEAFDGTLMLVLHRGMHTARVRAELFELAETPDGLAVRRDRSDLYAPRR